LSSIGNKSLLKCRKLGEKYFKKLKRYSKWWNLKKIGTHPPLDSFQQLYSLAHFYHMFTTNVFDHFMFFLPQILLKHNL